MAASAPSILRYGLPGPIQMPENSANLLTLSNSASSVVSIHFGSIAKLERAADCLIASLVAAWVGERGSKSATIASRVGIKSDARVRSREDCMAQRAWQGSEVAPLVSVRKAGSVF